MISMVTRMKLTMIIGDNHSLVGLATCGKYLYLCNVEHSLNPCKRAEMRKTSCDSKSNRGIGIMWTIFLSIFQNILISGWIGSIWTIFLSEECGGSQALWLVMKQCSQGTKQVKLAMKNHIGNTFSQLRSVFLPFYLFCIFLSRF